MTTMLSMRASPARPAGAGGAVQAPSARRARTPSARPQARPALFRGILDIGLTALARRLPQFDLVSIGIDEPAESTVFVLFDLADHLSAAEMDLAEGAVEIVDDQVEHEFARRGPEVIGVARKRTPHREGARRQRGRGEFDRRLAVAEAEPLGVPGKQSAGIGRLEEQSAETEDSRHVFSFPVHSSTTDARTAPARSCLAISSMRSPALPRTTHSTFARSSVT